MPSPGLSAIYTCSADAPFPGDLAPLSISQLLTRRRVGLGGAAGEYAEFDLDPSKELPAQQVGDFCLDQAAQTSLDKYEEELLELDAVNSIWLDQDVLARIQDDTCQTSTRITPYAT